MKYLKAIWFGILLGLPVVAIFAYYEKVSKGDVSEILSDHEYARENIYQTNPKKVINAILDIRDQSVSEWQECRKTIKLSAIITQSAILLAIILFV